MYPLSINVIHQFLFTHEITGQTVSNMAQNARWNYLIYSRLHNDIRPDFFFLCYGYVVYV